MKPDKEIVILTAKLEALKLLGTKSLTQFRSIAQEKAGTASVADLLLDCEYALQAIAELGLEETELTTYGEAVSQLNCQFLDDELFFIFLLAKYHRTTERDEKDWILYRLISHADTVNLSEQVLPLEVQKEIISHFRASRELSPQQRQRAYEWFKRQMGIDLNT